jgi:hypothetical protein
MQEDKIMGKIPPKSGGRRRYPEGVFPGRPFGIEDTDSSQVKDCNSKAEKVKVWKKILPPRRD